MIRDGLETFPSATGITSWVASEFSDLERISQQWDRLWSSNPNREIFGSFGWVRAWWSAYSSGLKLCTPIVVAQGEVIGIVPLVAEGRHLRFLGAPESDYNDILCEPGREVSVVQSALDALIASNFTWDRCDLVDVPEYSSVLSAMHNLPVILRSRIVIRRGNKCPTLLFGEDKSQVLFSILGKQSFRRHEKKVSNVGTLSFRHIEDQEDIRAHLPEFFRQHMRRRALMGEPSHFHDVQSQQFYEELTRTISPHSELRFSVLEASGRPIAYHLGFEVNGKFIFYKPTFDVQYWDSGPGEVLIARLFEYARKDSIREFDFTRGGEAYKRRFANLTRQNSNLAIYNHGMSASALWLADRALNRIPTLPWAAKLKSVAKTYLVRVFRKMRKHGPLGTIRLLLGQLSRTLWSRDEILWFIHELGSLPQPLPQWNLADFVFRQGTLGDIADYASQFPDDWNKRRFRQIQERMRAGHTLYVAAEESQIAHMVWVRITNMVGASEVPDVKPISLPTNANILYDGWTNPRYRGRGLYRRVLSQLIQLAHNDGRDAWGYSRPKNIVSLRGINAAGFRLKARMVEFKILRKFIRGRLFLLSTEHESLQPGADGR